MRLYPYLLSPLIWALASLSAVAGQGMTLEQIAKARTAGSVALHPNGEEIAYVLNVPRTPGEGEDGPEHSELHLVDARGDSRRYVGHGASPAQPAFSSDGEQLYFLGKREGDEHRQLLRIPLRGGEAREVLALETDIRGYHLSPDGEQVLLWALAPEDEELTELREKGFTQKIFEEDWRPVQLWRAALGESDTEPQQLDVDGSVLQAKWSPAGDRLAVKTAPRELIDDILMFPQVRIIDPDGEPLGEVATEGKLGSMAWSPDGEHLALITAEGLHDPREGRLSLVGKSGGEPKELLPDWPGHIWALAWPGERRLAFVSHEGTASVLREYDLDNSAEQRRLDSPAGVWRELVAGPGGELALVGHTVEHPSEVFRLAADEHRAKRLTDSNPWLADVALARQEVVRYTARDGVEIEGLLVHPLERDGEERVPLILTVHGGPEAHYSHGWLTGYHSPAQPAAARGYAVFYPNYRGSTGRGVAFTKMGQGRPAKEEFDDLVDGVEHLVERGLVDPDRVGITGGSYGGYASAWGATYYTEHFAAAVMNVGLSDKVSMLGTTDIPQELHLVHYRQWPWEDWSLYREASPIHYADQSRTPTLILHGEADTRVDPSQGKTLYRYLQLAGQAPVRLVLYPGEGHGNRRAASRWDYSLRLMRWMDHYLQGEGGEPPAYQLDYQLGEEE